MYEKFHGFTIPSHSKPVAALHALEDISNIMCEEGEETTPDSFLHARIVHVLPDEYAHTTEPCSL